MYSFKIFLNLHCPHQTHTRIHQDLANMHRTEGATRQLYVHQTFEFTEYMFIRCLPHCIILQAEADGHVPRVVPPPQGAPGAPGLPPSSSSSSSTSMPMMLPMTPKMPPPPQNAPVFGTPHVMGDHIKRFLGCVDSAHAGAAGAASRQQLSSSHDTCSPDKYHDLSCDESSSDEC